MQPGSAEHVNIRLDSAQWIATEADRAYFANLLAEIAKHARQGEKLDVVPIEQPFAWRRNYALLQALRKRGPDKAATAAAEEISRAAVAHSRLLNEFSADLSALKAFRDANRLQWTLLAEYVGLEDGDLADFERDERGQPINWRQRAHRIGGALARLQGMSAEERREVPARVEARRLRRHLKETAERLLTLERQNGELRQRIEALETLAPSMKETKQLFEEID